MSSRVARQTFSLGVLLASATALPVAAEEPTLPYQYSEEWSVVSAPGPAGPYQPVNIDPRVPGSALPMIPPAPAMLEPVARPLAETGSAGVESIADEAESMPGTTDPVAEIAEPAPGDIEPVAEGVESIPDNAEPLAEIAETAPADAEPAAEVAESAPAVAETVVEMSGSMPDAAAEAATEVAMPDPAQDIYTETLRNPPAAGRVEEPATYGAASSPSDAAAAVMPPSSPGYYQPVIPRGPAYGYPGPGNYGYPGQGWAQGYRNVPPSGYYRAPATTVHREPEIPPPPIYEEMQRRRPR